MADFCGFSLPTLRDLAAPWIEMSLWISL